MHRHLAATVEVPDRYAVVVTPVGGIKKLEFVSLTLDSKNFSRRATGVEYLVSRGWSDLEANAYLNSITVPVVKEVARTPRHGKR